MKKEFNEVATLCRFGQTILEPEKLKKASDFVTLLVRSAELAKLKNDKEYKDAQEALKKCYPTQGTKAFTDAQLKKALPQAWEVFRAHVDHIEKVSADIDKLSVTLADFNALGETDKVFITVEAHKNLSSVNIATGADFSGAVGKFFTAGKMRDVKDLLRVALHNAIGTQGEYFKGFSLKRSDLPDELVRHFCSAYAKGASRAQEKEGKTVKVGAYKYHLRTDKEMKNKALTELFGVLSESAFAELAETKTGTITDAPEQEQPKQEVGGLEPDNEPGGITVKKTDEPSPIGLKKDAPKQTGRKNGKK